MDTPCIEWPYSRDANGYGRIVVKGKEYKVSRIVCEMFHGPMPPKHQARHLCDNPPCFREDHIVPGTAKQNAHDRITHRRNGAPCTPRERDAALIFAADALRVELEVGHVDFAREYIGITDGMWSMLRRGKYSAGWDTHQKINELLRLYGRETVPFQPGTRRDQQPYLIGASA